MLPRQGSYFGSNGSRFPFWKQWLPLPILGAMVPASHSGSHGSRFPFWEPWLPSWKPKWFPSPGNLVEGSGTFV